MGSCFRGRGHHDIGVGDQASVATRLAPQAHPECDHRLPPQHRVLGADVDLGATLCDDLSVGKWILSLANLVLLEADGQSAGVWLKGRTEAVHIGERQLVRARVGLEARPLTIEAREVPVR